MLVVLQLPTNIFHFFVRKNLRFVGLVSGTNSGPVLDPRGPKRGPFSGPEHGPRKFMVLVCHCWPHPVKESWCGCVRSPRSEPHCCDVSAARRMAASYALSTIAASLAMSGWLRADVICDAFFNNFITSRNQYKHESKCIRSCHDQCEMVPKTSPRADSV